LTHIVNVMDIYPHAQLQEKEVAKLELLVQHINHKINVKSIQVVEDVSGIQQI